MFSQSKKKPSNTEARKNAIQSGLYFFLLDMRQKSSAADQAILSDLGLEFAHSNTYLTQRHAIYLNLTKTDFLPYLFDNCTRACHISVDRDYLEFEGGEQHDKLLWRYCHYTEEYKTPEGVQVLHIYFDSNGNVKEQRITNSAGISRDLTPEELSKIDFNIRYAKDIVFELISKKMERCRVAVDKLNSYTNTVPQDQEELSAVLAECNTLYAEAQRFADTNLILQTPARIAEILQQATDLVEVEETTTSAKVPKTAKVSKKVGTDNSVTPEKLKLKIDQKIAAIDELLKQSTKTYIQRLAELAEIKNFIILNLSNLSEDDKKLAQKALKKIPKENVADKLDPLLNPQKLTLKFVTDNFKIIEENCADSFYLKLIEAAIKESNPDRANELMKICEFLNYNSMRYAAAIRQANQITVAADGKQSNPLALKYLIDCFSKNKPKLFEMLLKHGISLGANTFLDEDDIVYLSMFKNLFTSFIREDSQYSANAKPYARFNNFLRIMLLPQYMAGAAYDLGVRGKLRREILLARLRDNIKKKHTAERSGGSVKLTTNHDALIDNLGLLGILDVAIKLNLPDDTLAIIIEAAKTNDTDLQNIAQDFGMYFSEQRFSVQVNPSDSPTLASMDKIAIINEDNLQSLLPELNSLGSRHIQQPTGSIDLRFFMMANSERSTSPEQLAMATKIMVKFKELLLGKINSVSVQDLIKTAAFMVDNLSNVDVLTATNSEEHRKVTGTLLGALLLLANLNPNESLQEEYYRLMYKAFCKLKCIADKLGNTVISSRHGEIIDAIYIQISRSNLANTSKIFECFDSLNRQFNIPRQARPGITPSR